MFESVAAFEGLSTIINILPLPLLVVEVFEIFLAGVFVVVVFFAAAFVVFVVFFPAEAVVFFDAGIVITPV